MLQRLSKNNDLVIQVEGAGIRKLEYYTDGEYKYVTDYVGETVYIPSSELKKMNDGLLNSTIYIGVDNDNFSDGTQERVVNLTFSIWIGSESTSPNVNEYYTKDEIDSMLGNGIDLEDYYTKEEIDAKIPTDYLTEIPSEYITEDELNSKGYLTNIPEEYITEQELNNRGYLTQHQDISHLATKDEIPTDYLTSVPEEYITEEELNLRGYLTEHLDISHLAQKSEIPDVSNFATVDLIPDVSNLATKDEIPTPYDDTALTNRVSSLESTVGNIEQILKEING